MAAGSASEAPQRAKQAMMAGQNGVGGVYRLPIRRKRGSLACGRLQASRAAPLTV